MKAAHSFKVVDGKIVEIKPNKHAGKPDKAPTCKVAWALIPFIKCDSCRREEAASDEQSFSA